MTKRALVRGLLDLRKTVDIAVLQTSIAITTDDLTGPRAARQRFSVCNRLGFGGECSFCDLCTRSADFVEDADGGARPPFSGSGFQRPDLVPGYTLKLDNPTPDRWFNQSCFAVPAQYTFGNAGRDIIEGPGTHNFDFSMFRSLYLSRGESPKVIQLREIFDITNTPQFDNPTTTNRSGYHRLDQLGRIAYFVPAGPAASATRREFTF